MKRILMPLTSALLLVSVGAFANCPKDESAKKLITVLDANKIQLFYATDSLDKIRNIFSKNESTCTRANNQASFDFCEGLTIDTWSNIANWKRNKEVYNALKDYSSFFPGSLEAPNGANCALKEVLQQR